MDRKTDDGQQAGTKGEFEDERGAH
jgi:hypothetical protein